MHHQATLPHQRLAVEAEGLKLLVQFYPSVSALTTNYPTRTRNKDEQPYLGRDLPPSELQLAKACGLGTFLGPTPT